MDSYTIEKLELAKVIGRVGKHAATSPGRQKVEALRPLTDPVVIERAQDEVQEATEILLEEGQVPFGGIKDIALAIKRAEKGFTLESNDFMAILGTLYGSRQVKKFFAELDGELRLLREYVEEISDFRQLENAIAQIFDDQGQVRDDASSKLQSLRREKRVVSTRIKEKLEGIITSRRLEKYIQEAVITIRDDRYVIPIKAEHRGSFPGILHDRSSSGQTLFIEPQAVVEMNNRLKSIEGEEAREIDRLLRELSDRIARQGQDLKRALEALASLDCIVARAHYGREMNCSRPALNPGGPVKLLGARHPLIDEQEVVPIDIFLGTNFSVLVITGPNTGGKTVTLKTTGLLSLMAQAGLPLPADEGSEIGVFQGIYADIGDEQSIEQNLSTFSSHLRQIVKILEKARAGDLVLLDEIGAGTDPEEGAALAMSILQHLYDKGILTVATTHYTELKAFAYTQEGVENAAVEFDVETLSPTYRLLTGVPGRSNAFAIASRLGLQDFIIEDAKKRLSSEEADLENMISRIEEEEYSLISEREGLARHRQKTEELEKKLKEEHQALLTKQDRIIREATEEARRLISGVKEEGSKLLKELREFGGPDADRLANRFNKALKEQEKKIEELLTSRSPKESKKSRLPASVRPGDTVRLLDLDQEGTVLEVNEEQVQVQVGIMKIRVSLRDVEKVLPRQKDRKGSNLSRLQGTKAQSISPRLSLRGFRWQEAREKTDKYLDDAYLAGLNKVELIHGKGTGALREGIHDLLASHPHVASFRLGQPGEGGEGITVVELKN